MTTTRRNWTPVLILSASQGLFFCAMSIIFTVSGLAGVWLAPTPALATVPLALTGVMTAFSALYAVKGFARFGRRPVFIGGAFGGVVAAGLSALAIENGNFVAFCLASSVFGLFQGVAQYYRLAAAEVAPTEADRPKAISWVMAGGLAAAFLGPHLGAIARDLTPTPFVGSYLVSASVSVLAVLVLAFWREPTAARVPTLPAWKPALGEIAANPALRGAIIFCVAAYGMMVLVMNASPLAIVACGLPVGIAASVVQWHLVGMFAPSFFTGNLIARHGARRIALIGCWLAIGGCLFAIAGETTPLFHASMIAVGVGWNFTFIGGSALLVQESSPLNRARIQSFNETLTFAVVTLAAFFAAVAQSTIGWAGVAIIGILILVPAMWPQPRAAVAPSE